MPERKLHSSFLPITLIVVGVVVIGLAAFATLVPVRACPYQYHHIMDDLCISCDGTGKVPLLRLWSKE